MKGNYLVVAADGARARFFILESARQMPESGAHLREEDDLANTEHELGGRDKYSTTRTGLNLDPGGGPSHGYDDHRARREQQHERSFARDIAARAISLAQRDHAACLVLAAEKHMLGLLRAALNVPVKSGIEVRELAKDLTKLTPAQIHEHLAAARIVPARKEPAPG